MRRLLAALLPLTGLLLAADTVTITSTTDSDLSPTTALESSQLATDTRRHALVEVKMNWLHVRPSPILERLPHLLLVESPSVCDQDCLRFRLPAAPDAPAATDPDFTLLLSPKPPQFQRQPVASLTADMDVLNLACTLELDYQVVDSEGTFVAAGTVSTRSVRNRLLGPARTAAPTRRSQPPRKPDERPHTASSQEDELLEDCLKTLPEKVLQKLADRFVATCTVTLLGPKGDTAFQPEQATILIDGEPLADDAPVKLAKGLHTIDVLLDGYTQTVRQFNLQNRTNAIRIVMRRARAH